MSITNLFDAAFVINLPERIDRRRMILKELVGQGIKEDDPWLNIFPAISPKKPGGFPSIGCRGCFLSHLQVFREIQKAGYPTALIMEDDLLIHPRFSEWTDQIQKQLKQTSWDIAYLGHPLRIQGNMKPEFQEYSLGIQMAHFYAITQEVASRLAEFFEAILKREPGHPDGGPMHCDGAISSFRKRNPDVRTIVSVPTLGKQRPSRTDIHQLKWFDRMPLIKNTFNSLRQFKKTKWE